MTNNLFLKPNEGKFLSMAVVALIEQLHATSTNPNLNWNPEVRKDLKEMREAGNSLRIKLEKLGFDMRDLPPYIDGEEKDYLTKES
jgi:hypothetical protein